MRTTPGFKWLLVPIVAGPLLMAGCLSIFGKASMPECPHDWDVRSITILNPKQTEVPLQTLRPDGNLSAPGMQTNVPEFNDCQRLVLGTGNTAEYDSLYAVFAWDSTDRDSVGVRAMFDSGYALPMVEVLSLGGTYDRLGLHPGFSCLFVFKGPSALAAVLLPFGAEEQDCHQPRSVAAVQAAPHATLEVTRFSYDDLQWGDYPAVARWEWDVKSNTQVIGFKCIDGWCEAGTPGHAPNTGPHLAASGWSSVPALSGVPGPSVLRIKGWYDEQRLAPAAESWWVTKASPRLVVGTIVPVPGLGGYEESDFDLQWKAIAYVDLSQPSVEYKTVAAYAPMTGTGAVTTISLCREDWGGSTPLPDGQGCKGISQKLRIKEAGKCHPEAVAPTVHWWAATMPAGETHPRYWCIVRRSAPDGVRVPGTARWRWLANDETSWGRCGGACCSGH